MPLFKAKKALPTTSYGYLPSPGATAHGWTCTNREECGTSEHELVRRWPHACPLCGSATDPLFDQPWAHEAEGVELRWLVTNHPERGGGYHQDRLHHWTFKDALLRGDRTTAERARSDAKSHATDRLKADSWWGPGEIYFSLIWYELEHREMDWAAEDLCTWLSLSSTDDVENDNTNRTNSRQVIDMVGRFLDAGGSGHPRFEEIRSGCLQIAADAFQILNREQQDLVNRLSQR